MDHFVLWRRCEFIVHWRGNWYGMCHIRGIALLMDARSWSFAPVAGCAQVYDGLHGRSLAAKITTIEP